MLLNNLPDEILLQVISYLDADCEDRVLGHIPDDPPPNPPDDCLTKDFQGATESQRNLALTCKRFFPLAQEGLYHAPVLGRSVFARSPATVSPTILSLLRVLGLQRLHLRYHVRNIRISISPERDGPRLRDIITEQNEGPQSTVPSAVIEAACSIIAALDLPQRLKSIWHSNIHLEFESTSRGILLGLLPQLHTICLSVADLDSTEDDGLARHDTCSLLGFDTSQISQLISNDLKNLPIVQSLTYLKVESPMPLQLSDLDLFPNLLTLDMSVRLVGQPNRDIVTATDAYRARGSCQQLSRVRHLRLDFQVKTVGIWHAALRTGMANIIQTFQHLKSLDCYAEPSDSKNPYHSVRSFPLYQANIQTFPYPPASLYPHIESQTYWDQRLYDARTEITDYQYLVDALVHLRSHLETLRLPGGFWTLPGGMRKPLPRFNQFVHLTTLAVPQAAIISIRLDNMRFDDVVGDFELSPVIVLPQQLQYLEVFDANIEFLTCYWLQEFFIEQSRHQQWPRMKRLEVCLGPPTTDIDVKEVRSRRMALSFWRLVEHASFVVVVGKDDRIPALRVPEVSSVSTAVLGGLSGYHRSA